MVNAYVQVNVLAAFLASLRNAMCCVQMRADCMQLALVLMRQWRSLTASVDLSSLVLLASFDFFGEFGDVKLIRPESPFYDNFKVSFLESLVGSLAAF